MPIEDWVLQALEQVADAGLGDDPLEGLTPEQVRHLVAEGLIRIKVTPRPASELGGDQPLTSRVREVSITAAGRRLLN